MPEAARAGVDGFQLHRALPMNYNNTHLMCVPVRLSAEKLHVSILTWCFRRENSYQLEVMPNEHSLMKICQKYLQYRLIWHS